MPLIEVRSPGMFTTVQDLGRWGYGPVGVSPSGAADQVALRLGNRLVGNPEGAAALEITMLGGTFVFTEAATVALTGGDFDTSLPMWQSHRIAAGESVKVGGARSGARCYLCVRGGVDTPRVLGSASAHTLSGLGGSALKKGDVVPIGSEVERPARGRVRDFKAFYRGGSIRITGDWQGQSFRVSQEANRVGIRLEGQPIVASAGGQMITEGVSLGAIQLPPGGQPIILFIDQQTTGGYPIIGNVVSADMASVAQLRPRDEVRFKVVSPEEARALLIEQERLLTSEEIFC